MVSVCMATFNGEKYILEQIESILPQLGKRDELVISDDGSTDGTLEIIRSLQDSRIKLLHNNERHGVAGNFENAIRHASGEVIFLSDQDDVWLPGKIEGMMAFLKDNDYDIITCSCSFTDAYLNVTTEDYYAEKSPLDKSAFGNFIKDLWLGCCMAFNRRILTELLPFPPKVAAHDLWIALYGQLKFKCGYYPKVLQLYRRHDNTVSYAGEKSANPLRYKLSYRAYLINHLIKRLIKNYHHR
ncbi:MAG: glycosyltransferase family 2 protein [Muribaculaceae bacterium]|nr:glycosyltransferase family 2 protein [Muribaculaceae bacterium]